VNRALLLLLGLDLRGRFIRRLRLLRQPRYLIASLAGAAYFVSVLLPRLGDWRGSGGHFGAGGPGGVAAHAPGAGTGALAASGMAAILPFAAGLVLALGTTLVWLFSSSKPALRLGEAELHLLLPAPLPRRTILAYALLKQQVGILAGALLVVVIRGAGPSGQRLARLFGTWALLTLFDLHVKGVSLWKARLGELPPAKARREVAAAVALGALFWASIGWSLVRLVIGAGGSWSEATIEQIARSAVAGLPGALLAPFLWLSHPLVGYFAPRAGDRAYGWSVLFVLLVLAAHYEWVLRSRGRFEEAALAAAQRKARQRARRFGFRPPAARARQRQPFALPPAGRPETAIYWKNLMLRGRTPLRRTALRLAVICVAVGTVNAALGAPQAMASILAGIGLAAMLCIPPFAGLWLRNDLRADLRQLETLRSWPLDGSRLVAAELLAPATSALFLIGTGYGLLVAGVLPVWLLSGQAATPPPHMPLQPLLGNAGGPGVEVALVVGASLLPLGLAIALLSIAIQNLATLILPGWMILGYEPRRGSVFTGLRMLVFLGHVVAMALGLLPPLLLLAAALLLQRLLGFDFRLSEAPPAALLAAAPLLLEVWLLARLGGARWHRLDPSREVLETD
jgi:ABC-2 type transport system permease protein